MRSARSVVLLLSLSIAGCGGGGSASPAAAPTVTVPANLQPGTLALTLAPPTTTTSSAKRSPAFVSSAAVSAAIQLNGSTAQYFNLTQSSGNCTSNSSGLLSCTLPIAAPLGNVVFAVGLYSAANGGGTELGFGSNSTTVVAGTPFSVSVGINPAVAGVASFTVSNGGTYALGTPATATLTITFADPALQPILGSGNVPNFLTAVTLTSSDPHIRFSPSTLTTPGQTSTVSYDGSPAVASSVTLTAKAGSTTLGSVPLSIPGLLANRILLGAAGTIYPEQITVGSDGNLWFTENMTTKVDQVTTAGALTRFTETGMAQYIQGIATGGDGDLYVATEPNCDIYRIAPSSPTVILNTIAVPGGTCLLASLQEDASGNVWFLDINSPTSRVGYVAVPGLSVNVYNTPTSNAFGAFYKSGITLGPDNAMWFAEYGVGKLGRVGTPASGGTGTVTEYAVPNATGQTVVVGIAKGSDNNVWLTVPNFTTTSDQFFAYFSPSTPSTINEYPNVINSANFANWVLLTAGSDGNLWTTQGAGAVKIPPGNPSGAVIGIFTDGVGTDNQSSVTGPDGSIWFTGLGSGSINDQVVHYLPR